MPQVTLQHIFPATYVQAPVSALVPNRPGWVGASGTLGVLRVRYGSDESRTRQICAFVGDGASFITDPGLISQGGDVITHVYRTEPTEGILREPLRDNLTGEYTNAWWLTGPDVRNSRARADFLDSIKMRWRVLRRAEMGNG